VINYPAGKQPKIQTKYFYSIFKTVQIHPGLVLEQLLWFLGDSLMKTKKSN
jgi:hypothetical protein